ncbi:MAG TPA: type 4a pilus biogenesis protein PilO [Acidobacteriota bacterium]|jgi:type IV pilus assembly protein PilO
MALKDSRLANLPFRTQVILLSVLLAAIAYVFYVYFIAPKRLVARDLDERTKALTAEVQRGLIVEARLPQFKAEIARQRDYLNNLRNILPEEKETADIVRRVEQLAVSSNLRIKSFTPQQTVQRDFYEDWPILISVEGSYDNLGTFFEKVGKFTRIINVDNLSIKGVESNTSQKTLSATCTATTFVFLETKNQS